MTRKGGGFPHGDVPEPVVARRARILDPVVAADDPAVAVAHAGVGGDPVHRAADPVGAGRRRAVALAAVSATARCGRRGPPRAGDRLPAAALSRPQAQRRVRRRAARRLDGDQLRAGARRRPAGGRRGLGGGRERQRRAEPARSGRAPWQITGRWQGARAARRARGRRAAAGAAAGTRSSARSTPSRAASCRYSWRAGCPVGPAQLRLLRLSYWGFDGKARVGSLVVRDRVARDVVAVFRRLYAARFPIRRLRKVDAYRGSDDASMAADNTSGFNCRFVSGTRRWSQHAYGEAIDVNPVENPYVQGARVSPPAGARYLDRSTRPAAGWRCQEACWCARSPRWAGSGAAAGAARPTTSISRRRGVRR